MDAGSMADKTGVKVVMIGGGTGSFTLLSVLKNYVNDITAIVNMVDDGGSTGILRDELGALPPGDVRQCLVALSRSSETMRQLFNYRFPQGSFEGHAFGNLFLTALEKTSGSFGRAVEEAGHILNIQGQVVPVTLADTRLELRQGQRVLKGERTISQSWFKGRERPRLSLSPKAELNPQAATAIKQADLVVIAPGNLYSSLVPTLLVEGMPQALQQSRASKVYVCNLVTKPGQTDGFNVGDFVDELERYGGQELIDCVIYNNRKPSADLLKRYAKAGEDWVAFDEQQLEAAPYRAIGENLVSDLIHHQDPNDIRLQRTLIRHDADKVARILMRISLN